MKSKQVTRLIAILSLVFTLNAYGQQDPMYAQYMFNTLSINPGYAGSQKMLSGLLLHRQQWMQLEGAPVTQTFTLHGPLYDPSFAVGGTIINDKIGPTNTTGFYLDFAYRYRVTVGSFLSFGLKAGMNIMQGRLQELTIIDEGDPDFGANVQSRPLPNVGFGIYYHASKFYAGISAPKMLENTISQAGTTTAHERRHYFFMMGTKFALPNYLEFKPMVLAKMVQGAPVSVDLTANLIYAQKILVGVMYRHQDAVGLIFQYHFNPQLRAGLAYEYSTSALRQVNRGSYELMLSYDLNLSNVKITHSSHMGK